MYFQISLKFVVPNWHVIVGLGNGLAPNRRQAISHTTDDSESWPPYDVNRPQWGATKNGIVAQ